MESTLDHLEPYVPGMREQVHGKGIRMFVEHEFAPLHACLVGHPVEMWMPDPDRPEVRNGIGDMSEGSDLVQTYRRVKGKHLKEADPELYEHFCVGSDALATSLADAGVRVIRTDFVPPEIVNMNTGWVDSKQLSMFPAGAGEVFGNVFVATLEVSMGWRLELPFRDALSSPRPRAGSTLSCTGLEPRPERLVGDSDVRTVVSRSLDLIHDCGRGFREGHPQASPRPGARD